MSNLDDSSYKTAITRRGISLPVRKLIRYNVLSRRLPEVVLDYGCGKGHDAEHIGCDRFDPHYFPVKLTKKYNVILCTYVLNVVSETTQKKIIDNIVSLLSEDHSMMFISVRRDIPKEGTATQRWVELPPPFKTYFSTATYKTYYAYKSDFPEPKVSEAAGTM